MSSQHKSGWVRGLRPLFWWLVLVLVLYGIRWNQQQLEQTRLSFLISLNGQPLVYPVAVTWDGRPINNGDKIALGGHLFKISGPNTKSFTTNISAWYGKHDLGEIRLARSFGTLSIKADPPPETITISGSEYSTTLQNCVITNLTVPTGDYAIAAHYQNWSDSRTIEVKEDSASPVEFNVGTLSLACNRSGASFQIQNESGPLEHGVIPSTIPLPPGSYQVWAFYKGWRIQESTVVQKGSQSDLQFRFDLGAVNLETSPEGAEVYSTNGDILGSTPLLTELPPQTAIFKLALAGYEPASVTLNVSADQTNYYSTNLVSAGYLSAIREAKSYLMASNFEAAAQAAAGALSSKPGDADALAIQGEANKYLEGERQQRERLERPKKCFDDLCAEYPAADLFAEHDLETGKSASAVASGIVASLTNSPNIFKIVKTASPEPDTYEIVAKQTDFLGVNERDCLIVIGSPNNADTQIRFKVLEFEIQHHLAGDNQLIPLSQSKVENNSLLLLHVQQGLQTVTDKIQKAITLSTGRKINRGQTCQFWQVQDDHVTRSKCDASNI